MSERRTPPREMPRIPWSRTERAGFGHVSAWLCADDEEPIVIDIRRWGSEQLSLAISTGHATYLLLELAAAILEAGGDPITQLRKWTAWERERAELEGRPPPKGLEGRGSTDPADSVAPDPAPPADLFGSRRVASDAR